MTTGPKKRNSAQRHRVILNEIEKKGYITVQEISQQLNVSEVTIRKDLKQLEERKMLLRSHRGEQAR